MSPGQGVGAPAPPMAEPTLWMSSTCPAPASRIVEDIHNKELIIGVDTDDIAYGESYQHDQHRQSLIKELGDLNVLINQLDGAWEIENYGKP